MDWIKKSLLNTVLILFSIGITLVMLDLGLRHTHYNGLVSTAFYPQGYFIADEEIGLDIAPNFATSTQWLYDHPYPVWSNELGCFDTHYDGRTPYIYLTGDSYTWGFTPFESKWGTLLEQGLGVRVLKCGVAGFGTKQELIKTTRDMARLPAPALIMVGYDVDNDQADDKYFPRNTVRDGYRVGSYNDLSPQEAEEKYALLEKYCVNYLPAHPWIQEGKCWLFQHSVLYNLLRNNLQGALSSLPRTLREGVGLINTADESEKSEISPEGYASHLENIKAFKTMADRLGSKLLFVLVLVKGENETPERAAIRDYLSQNNIPFVDLAPEFNKHDPATLAWKNDGHWNIEGNRLAADIVAAYVAEHYTFK
jgi:hypothetical protein